MTVSRPPGRNGEEADMAESWTERRICMRRPDLEQVFSEHQLRQILTVADGIRQADQPVLVHFEYGQLLQATCKCHQQRYHCCGPTLTY